MKNSLQLLAGLALLGVLAGCGDTTRVSRLGPAPTGSDPGDPPQVAAEAGIDINLTKAVTTDVVSVAKNMHFVSRPNDFALGVGETAFDQEQKMLNLFGQAGGYFQAEYIPMEERPVSDEIKRIELPFWRLSGIVIGDSVTALLETAPGQTRRITPGMRIGDEWVVVSIDSEKAVLRRTDNAEPNTMEVKLSSPSAIGGGSGGSGGGTGGSGTGTPARGGGGAPPLGGSGTGK